MISPTLTAGGKVLKCLACTEEFKRSSRTQVHCSTCSGRLKDNPRQWAIELRQRVAALEAAIRAHKLIPWAPLARDVTLYETLDD